MGDRALTVAAKKLRTVMRERGWSQVQLAEHLGTSTAAVSRWLTGDRLPSLAMALAIEGSVDIPVQGWRRPVVRR